MRLGPNLEKALRPFSFDPNRPLPRDRASWSGATPVPEESTTEESTEGVLQWKARTGMEVLTLPGLAVNLKEDDKDPDFNLREVSRQTHVVRVTNPEDPDMYVDVEVAKSLTLVNQAKQRRTFNLSN